MKFTKENVYKMVERYSVDQGYLIGDLKIDISKLDDTPEKIVVPKFVAEFYELYSSLDLQTILYRCDYSSSRYEDFIKWYLNQDGRHKSGRSNSQEIIAKMYLYGYEVEKELLYHVALPKLGDSDFCYLWIDDFGAVYPQRKEVPSVGKFKFTEQEIKAIDERYWPFAVKVSDE